MTSPCVTTSPLDADTSQADDATASPLDVKNKTTSGAHGVATSQLEEVTTSKVDVKASQPDVSMSLKSTSPSTTSPVDVMTLHNDDTPSVVMSSMTTERRMDFDELMDVVGDFGIFQAIVFVFVSLGILAEVMFVLVYVFVAATPPHWCSTPDLDLQLNISLADRLRLTIPPQESLSSLSAAEWVGECSRGMIIASEEEGGGGGGGGGDVEYSSCNMYDRNYTGWTYDDVINALKEMDECFNDNYNNGNNNHNDRNNNDKDHNRNNIANNNNYIKGDNNSTCSFQAVISCRSGWTYDLSIYKSTIVTEWDLVCSKTWMTSFAYTVVGIGQLIGATFWGFVIDRYGRKRPYYLALSLMICSSLCVSFSPNYTIYCCLQLIMAINSVAVFAIGVTLAVELSGVKWRAHLATAVNYFWTIGYMLLAAVAFALRDWSMLQLVISASLSILLLGAFFVPESPRWLYCQGRTKEADDVIQRLTRFNKVSFPSGVIVTCSSEGVEGETMSVIALCKTNRLRVFSFILGFNWFANALIYYGISLLLPTLSEGSAAVYLSFFISGAVEIPGYIMAQLLLMYVGRKVPLCATLLIGGVALLCTMAIPEDLAWLSTTLALIGKLCVTASWAIAICFTAELYPTVLRGIGLFVCTLCGNIGNAVAPQVGLLGQFSVYIPFLIFGVFSLSAGVTSLLLPETKGQHLTDTVDQVPDFSRIERKLTEVVFSSSAIDRNELDLYFTTGHFIHTADNHETLVNQDHGDTVTVAGNDSRSEL